MLTSSSAGSPSQKGEAPGPVAEQPEPNNHHAHNNNTAGGGAYNRFIKRWTAFSHRHPFWVLLLPLILTAVAWPFAKQLRVDTDFKKLLPRSYPSVALMDTAIAKVGDLGYFSVVIDHEDTQESLRFAAAFKQHIEKSPYVRTVLYENPVDFLRHNRFLLLSNDKLTKLKDHILQKRREKSPFSLGLDDEANAASESGTPSPNGNDPAGDSATMQGLAQGEQTAALDSSDNEDEPIDLEAIKEQWRKLNDMKRHHVSDDGRIVAMQIRPQGSVTNIAFVRKMFEHLKQEIQVVQAQGFSDSMVVDVSGSLRNKLDEYHIIISDVLRSSWVSGSLILCILLIVFRNPLAVLLLLIPLICGLTWTFALAQQAVGFLDAISAMLFVVLFGLGIDHGIHLLKRYIQLRPTSFPQEAMEQTLTHTGRAVWVSALTTAGGFFLMLVADFKGFIHLGFIAGAAMVLITAAYFMTLPALTFAFAAKRGMQPKWQVGAGVRFWRWFGTQVDASPTRWPLTVGVVLLVMGALAGAQLEFNYDFNTLIGINPESEVVKKKQSKVYTESLTPGTVLFAPDDATLDKLVAALKARKDADTETPTIGRTISMRNFVPADQEERLATIREAARLVTPLVLKKEKDRETRKILAQLRRSADLEPITYEDVPPQIKEFFTPKDGSDDRMIFIFPSIERRRIKEAFAFAEDMTPFTIDGKDYHPTGDSLIFAAIFRLVIDQGLTIFALSFLTIVLLVFLQFRKPAVAIRPVLALLAGLGLMAILLIAFDVDINFYNMIIFAAVVGMGIDSSIHLCAHWARERQKSDENGTASSANPGTPSRAAATVKAIGGAITTCAITTTAGYCGMIFSHHRGLQSIGILAVAGLGACWLVAITLLPLYLRVVEQRSNASQTGATIHSGASAVSS